MTEVIAAAVCEHDVWMREEAYVGVVFTFYFFCLQVKSITAL